MLKVTLTFLLCFSLAYGFLLPHWWPYSSDDKSAKSDLSMGGLVLPHGYPLEEHDVLTEDNYILTIYRIPYGLKNKTIGGRPPLLLQHGILAASSCWVLSEPDKGLGFILADAGYDVWLGNNRGTTYSLKHKFWDHEKNAKDYYNFSFHEMGMYDLPAMIDYVLNATNSQSLHYVAHSQGTTQFFVMGSTRPEYNDKIKVASLLAPVAYLEHTRGIIRDLSIIEPLLEKIVNWFHIYSILNNSWFLNLFDTMICRKGAITLDLCNNLLFLIAGYDSQQLNVSLVPTIANYCPAGTSTKQLIHFGELTKNNRFCMFDYGKDNMKYYNRTSPFDYDVSKITATMYLHHSLNDWLAGPDDVETLYLHLNKNNTYLKKVSFPYFNHLDYMWARDVDKLLYNDVVKILKQY